MLRKARFDFATMFLVCARAARLAVVAACAAWCTGPSVSAQSAGIDYWIAVDGVPVLPLPPAVTDNGPGDLDLNPGQVQVSAIGFSNAKVTLLPGTLIWGFKIPGVNGRNLTVTGVDGFANPGSFALPASTIDIHACYRFNGPGLTVPGPNVHTRVTFGTLQNNVSGLISLAGVRYISVRNGACSVDPGDPGAFALYGFGQVVPSAPSPIPFFNSTTFALSPMPCYDLTTVTRLTLGINGDEVVLPGSAESMVVAVLDCNTGGSGGAIPAVGTGDGVYPGTLPSAPMIGTLAASPPAGSTVVTGVRLNGLTHTYIGDLHVVLQDPSGNKHNIFCRPGSGNFSCDYGGDYTFVGQCDSGLSLPAGCTTSLAPGTFEQSFGTWASGTNGINNTPLNSISAAAGTWTLYVYDWAAVDTGALTSWDICFGAPPTPTTGLATLLAPTNGATVSASPNLIWSAASCATSHDVDVDGIVTSGVAGTSFPTTVSPGLHTWRVRGVSGSTPGEWTGGQTFTFEPPIPCSELQTLFASNNNGAVGGQVFLDLNVTNPSGITVGEIGINTAAAGNFTLDVYARPGSYVGNTTLSGWGLVTSGTGSGAGVNAPSIVDVADVTVPPGSYGIALVLTGAGHSYTNGTGTNQSYSNSDMSLSLGAALNVPWTGTPFTPRVWNGIVRYNCQTLPVAYCTAGTSTNGCVPSISATAQPSASFAHPCSISIANVEGQKFGIIFYGINQTGFSPAPWGIGSNSFLCIKGPTQRTGSTVSGGTNGLCDGALTLDWNAFQMANPGAVGNPFAAGNKAYVQGWYRDPPAVKTTNLSNALDMTLQL